MGVEKAKGNPMYRSKPSVQREGRYEEAMGQGGTGVFEKRREKGARWGSLASWSTACSR